MIFLFFGSFATQQKTSESTLSTELSLETDTNEGHKEIKIKPILSGS
ncbi:MAG: hypothetical protein ACRCTQ_04650 [Brevinemataceae bacterium]